MRSTLKHTATVSHPCRRISQFRLAAGTIAMPVLATDADGDTIFLFDVDISNSTVADIHYPNLGPYAVQEIYYHLQPVRSTVGRGTQRPVIHYPNRCRKHYCDHKCTGCVGRQRIPRPSRLWFTNRQIPPDGGMRYQGSLFPYPGWNPSRFCC